MDESTAPDRRLPAIDVLRGVALAAMVVYHFSWDLAYHRLVDWQVAADPAWKDFARSIAASFLFISGLSLALAARDGIDVARHGKRIAKIALAAAAVSLVTWFVFPDAFVFFGILHMIAAGSLLATPLLRAPAALPMLLGIGFVALPQVWSSPVFDAPALWWVGLAPTVPPSNDYVPVFPWFGPMLIGIGVGRLIAAGAISVPRWKAEHGPGRWLAVAGRWTLPVYLVHQPILFSAVAGAALVLPVDPVAEKTRFVAECTAECAKWDGTTGDYCPRFCGCVADALAGTRQFTVRGGPTDAESQSLVATAAATCRAGEDAEPDFAVPPPALESVPPAAPLP